MFDSLDRLPPDPILGSMAAYRADADPAKVDLGVGVYRDERGETPILAAVKRAEASVLAHQTTKSYVSSIGNAQFNRALEELTLGVEHPALAGGRVRTIQAPGGCGALRLGAELIKAADARSVVHVSTPTWANHTALIGGSGLKLANYVYYDAARGGLNFEGMMAALGKLPSGSVVLLQACCHNPTGVDLTDAQWRALLPIFKRGALLPFIDMAYQGLGRGIAEDTFGIRLFAAELPEVLVAVSCSKNFGLYRERTGALHVIAASAGAADKALSQLARIARTIYSMPPDHGAAIVQEIMGNDALRTEWLGEVGVMRARMTGLRNEFVQQLSASCPQRDFACITRQFGMFSLLGINTAQVHAMRVAHHVYMTDDSRINIAGLRAGNLAYVARAVAQVLRERAQ
jgi:aspartate aminotransferase